MAPRRPWAGLTAAVLLGGSPLLLKVGREGLLDAGMAFFALLTMVAVCRAEKGARWWFVAALGMALGMLQKTPLAIPVGALMVLVLGWGRAPSPMHWRSLLHNPTFLCALVLTVLLGAMWPILQTLRHGVTFAETFFLQQMWQRLLPGRSDSGGALRVTSWLFDDAPVAWAPAALCALAVPFTPSLRRNRALLAGVFCLAGAGFVLATQVTALQDAVARSRGDAGEIASVARAYAEALHPSETPVWFDTDGSPAPEAFIWYAALGRPVYVLREHHGADSQGDRPDHRLQPPHSSVCPAIHFALLNRCIGPLEQVRRVGSYLIWRHAANAASEPSRRAAAE